MALFFINQVRSGELKKRLLELNQLKESFETPVSKTKTKREAIKELNQSRKNQATMLEVIIMLASRVDYISDPNMIDDIFQKIGESSLYTGVRTP